MSLRYGILGLLARQSLTGYDLTKHFDTTVGFFWSAKHSQIYPELANLTQEGLVTFEVVAQTSKPNKKVYTITAEGREALTAWAASPAEKRNIKDSLLMRLWPLGTLPGLSLLPQLRQALGEAEGRFQLLTAIERDLTQQGLTELVPGNPGLGAVLALNCGLRQAAAYRDWLKDTIAVLEAADAARVPGLAPATPAEAPR